MKETFTVVVFIFLSFGKTFGQNKQMTIEWLTYNLNKYFNSTYSFEDEQLMLKMIGGYTYYHREFKVEEDKLIVEETTNTKIKDKAGKKGGTMIFVFYLSKITNIYFTPDSDLGNHRLNIDFSRPTSSKDYTLRRINRDTGEYIEANSYPLGWDIITCNNDVLENDIGNRVSKAFVHLVKLVGGNPVQDSLF